MPFKTHVPLTSERLELQRRLSGGIYGERCAAARVPNIAVHYSRLRAECYAEIRPTGWSAGRPRPRTAAGSALHALTPSK